ncbi:MAG: cyclic nucleotide-binding domain-containing protein [Pirellulales bacterium]|nr:cyclic nucleotide-binding domain-containing protein [Pirellulales bacterium]
MLSQETRMISPEVLRRYPYFAEASDHSLKQLAMAGHEMTVQHGATMFNEGEPADYLYIIINGKVDIVYSLPNGRHSTVDTLVDGDLLVWSALIPPHRTTGSAIATKDTHLVSLEAVRVRAVCEQDPRVGSRLMREVVKLLSNRLDGVQVQLAVRELKS